MAEPASPNAPARNETLREKLRELLVPVLASVVLTWLVEKLVPFDLKGNPAGALLLGVSLFLVAYIGWQLLMGARGYTLGGRFRWFFVLYMLLFMLAASNDVLHWRQELLGYRESVPRNFLALNRLGDWHYWFAPGPEAPQDLVVLTIPSNEGQTIEEVRADLMFLVQSSLLHGARVVGLDFYFDLESLVDSNFCEVIDRAWTNGMPVVAGYRHTVDGTLVNQLEPAASLRCLRGDRLGHLAVYREWDARVRMVPVDLGGREELKSLSYRLARLSARKPLSVPESRLVQFTAPEPDLAVLSARDLVEGRRSWDAVRGRVVLVGRETPQDRHQTPFGERLGVMLHGYSLHALRSGSFIRRPSWLWSVPLLFCSCYLLSALFMRGIGLRRLVGTALVLHLGFVLMAIVAMRLWLVWLDVIYLALAVWLLLLLLWVMGRRLASFQAPPVRSEPGPVLAEAKTADRDPVEEV